MSIKDKIVKVFSDGRSAAARERRELRLKEINSRYDDLYLEARRAMFVLENERSKEIDAIYEKYRSRFGEIEDRHRPEQDELRQEADKLNEELREFYAKATEKVAAVLAEDLADNPLVKEVKGTGNEGRVIICLKPITIKRSLKRDVGTTNGSITVIFNPRNGSIDKFHLDSEGRRHPHGSCLNQHSYDYAIQGDFNGAVYDFAMALSVSEPGH